MNMIHPKSLRARNIFQVHVVFLRRTEVLESKKGMLCRPRRLKNLAMEGCCKWSLWIHIPSENVIGDSFLCRICRRSEGASTFEAVWIPVGGLYPSWIPFQASSDCAMWVLAHRVHIQTEYLPPTRLRERSSQNPGTKRTHTIPYPLCFLATVLKKLKTPNRSIARTHIVFL